MKEQDRDNQGRRIQHIEIHTYGEKPPNVRIEQYRPSLDRYDVTVIGPGEVKPYIQDDDHKTLIYSIDE